MKVLFKKILLASLLSTFVAFGGSCAVQQGDLAEKKSEKQLITQTENNESCHTTPTRAELASASDKEQLPTKVISSNVDSTENMVLINGGTFTMGTNHGMPFEAPAHNVTVKSFWIDEAEVTVKEFADFVEATGYITEAERFGASGVFDVQTGAWTMKENANWRTPEGNGELAQLTEPVCQISWNDAQAYAKWAGKRLPTEAEWEFAARGNLKNKEYAWGDNLRPTGKPVANWWQGEFPFNNTGEDGFRNRAPVKSFAPNNYGLYDVAGNVWEWCADWYAPDYYETSPNQNPEGPEIGEERVIRGGSWMCAENFCTNYRVAGRSHSTPDTGLNNLGFRCVRDAKK